MISEASSNLVELPAQRSSAGQQAQDEAPPFRRYRDIPIMDDVEPLENYGPGGLIPLEIGFTLQNRFQVYYKLGFGGIATVWLCYDLETQKWRAVKVNAASHSSEDCPDVLATNKLKESFKPGVS